MKFDFPDKLLLTATCASGTESVLKKEIERLGFGVHPAENGAITFPADKLGLADACLNFRTADRVYVKIAEFDVLTFDEMFDGVRALPWESYIPSDGRVTVNGKCVKSKIYSISDSQKIIKKALADRLCERYKLTRLPENGALYEISFSLFRDKLSLMLNASGAGLHKRGYRDMVGIAPIKETLASALLLMSDFYYKRPFCDPFCGSGTFVIEGARIALNIAAGINRTFAFNSWENFDPMVYKTAYEKAKDNEMRDRSIEFFGSDIDPKAVKLATRHAARAGVGDKVKFFVKDAASFSPRSEFGTVVTNPPYGIRVYDREQAEACYKSFGKAIKAYPGWSAFVVTAAKNFEKCFGRKADRNRKTYNSDLECKYYYYYGEKPKSNDAVKEGNND